MKEKHSHSKHMLFMILGCIAPLLLIYTLSLLNIGNKLTNKAYWIIFLICPIMHIIMMKGMSIRQR